jgi:hypothetical protein
MGFEPMKELTPCQIENLGTIATSQTQHEVLAT